MINKEYADNYINRQLAIDALGDVPYVPDTWSDEYLLGKYHQYKQDKAAIESVLLADVDPVRHGHWEVAIGYDSRKRVKCSVCNLMNYDPTDYCPHCGARMDGGKRDGQP